MGKTRSKTAKNRNSMKDMVSIIKLLKSVSSITQNTHSEFTENFNKIDQQLLQLNTKIDVIERDRKEGIGCYYRKEIEANSDFRKQGKFIIGFISGLAGAVMGYLGTLFQK